MRRISIKKRGETYLLLCLLLWACGKEKKILVEEQLAQTAQTASSIEKLGEPMMQPSQTKEEINWLGTTYQYEIVRNPNETEFVYNDQGEKFFDNQIELTISKEGALLFSQTLQKRDFAQHVSSDFMKNGILEAIVFDKIGHDGLHFAASICYPQSDLFIPLLIIINSQGDKSIRKDTLLDTEGEEMED